MGRGRLQRGQVMCALLRPHGQRSIMEIKYYEDMTVELMQAPENATVLTGLALNLTMRRDTDIVPVNEKKCQFLVDAEHMSVFEHAHFTFLVQGISRSLLAQVTRQRTANITSGSQHYQDYSEYPAVISKDLDERYPSVRNTLSNTVNAYRHLFSCGVPREEARQVLPNAAAVHILWTMDARNLFYFLRQRLCNRNVLEMKIFATKVRNILLQEFPELFTLSGPQCFRGKCQQGRMQCTQKVWVPL